MFLFSLSNHHSAADNAAQVYSNFANIPALNTPRLASMDNFRDIAGTTTPYTTRYGKMRSGVFYRSNAVVPSAADRATLEKLAIRGIFDLRTQLEIAKAPDVLPVGALYRAFDVLASQLGNVDPTTFRLESEEQAVSLMEQLYRTFVNSAPVRAVLGEVLIAMEGTQGPLIFHCSAGKDRTGWVSALLHSIAGADDATIMSDFMATNTFTAQRVNAMLAAMPDHIAKLYAPALRVNASYLNAALQEVSTHYGTMDAYLQHGLNVPQQVLSHLRHKLIE